MPIRLGRTADERLAAMASAASKLRLTYDQVGMTEHDTAPDGFKLDRYEASLGSSDGVLEAGGDALRRWAAHRGAGARVAPVDAPLEVGTDVVVALNLPGATAIAPCRIVRVVDEPDRFGFAYGTLQGHPESGEESFILVRRGTDVWFQITAMSHPATLTSRIGNPVVRRIQAAVSRRYLAAMQQAVKRP